MSSIKTNIPAMIAQNSLRRVSIDMDKSMERLSSGKRINAGSDDPAGLSMAARIKSGALTERQAASNANDVIAMVQSYSETLTLTSDSTITPELVITLTGIGAEVESSNSQQGIGRSASEKSDSEPN